MDATDCELYVEAWEWDRAWLVSYLDGNGEPGAIVYAPHYRAAKAAGLAALNVFGAEWEYLEVSRQPKYDELWPSGPSLARRLADGWHWECGGCYDTVDAEGCWREGHAGGPVIDEAAEEVFCCAACQQEHARRRAPRGPEAGT